MRDLFLALVFACVGSAASAQLTIRELENLSCSVLVTHLETDGILDPTVGVFLDGVMAATDALYEGVSLPARIVQVCGTVSSEMTIAEALRRAVQED